MYWRVVSQAFLLSPAALKETCDWFVANYDSARKWLTETEGAGRRLVHPGGVTSVWRRAADGNLNALPSGPSHYHRRGSFSLPLYSYFPGVGGYELQLGEYVHFPHPICFEIGKCRFEPQIRMGVHFCDCLFLPRWPVHFLEHFWAGFAFRPMKLNKE